MKDFSTMEAFPDNKSHIALLIGFVVIDLKSIEGKTELTNNYHSLLFLTMFPAWIFLKVVQAMDKRESKGGRDSTHRKQKKNKKEGKGKNHNPTR